MSPDLASLIWQLVCSIWKSVQMADQRVREQQTPVGSKLIHQSVLPKKISLGRKDNFILSLFITVCPLSPYIIANSTTQFWFKMIHVSSNIDVVLVHLEYLCFNWFITCFCSNSGGDLIGLPETKMVMIFFITIMSMNNTPSNFCIHCYSKFDYYYYFKIIFLIFTLSY